MDRNTSIWDYYRINKTTGCDADSDTDSDFDPNAPTHSPRFDELFASPGHSNNENNLSEAILAPQQRDAENDGIEKALGDKEGQKDTTKAEPNSKTGLAPKERDWSRYFAGYYTSRPNRPVYNPGQNTGHKPVPRQGYIDAEIKTWPLIHFNIMSQPKAILNMPPSFVALDDRWVFLCTMFFDCQQRYKAWPNDFMAEGRMRMTRPPVGGGVYVFFEPAGRYYMLEAFGYYLLGGDAVGRTGKWVYRSFRTSELDPKSLPELSFGNFRMPASWKPGAEDLVLRYRLDGSEKLVMLATPWTGIENLRLPCFWFESEFVLSEWSPDEKVGWIGVDGSKERGIAARRAEALKNAESSQEVSTPVVSGSEQPGNKRRKPPSLEIRAQKKRHSAPTSDPGACDKHNNLAHRPLNPNGQQPFSVRPSSVGISTPTGLHQQLFPSSREADRRKTLTEIMSHSTLSLPSSSAPPRSSSPQIPPDHIFIKKSDLDTLRAQRNLFYESHLRSILDWSTLLSQEKTHCEAELSAIQVQVEANNAQYEALKVRFVSVQEQLVLLEGLERRGPRNEEVSVAGFPPLVEAFEGLRVDGELDVIRGKVEEMYERNGAREVEGGENCGVGDVSRGRMS